MTEVGLDTRDMRVFASTVEDALFGDVFRDVGEAALLLLIPIVSAIFKYVVAVFAWCRDAPCLGF